MEVFENLKANLVGKNARIVLPEGEEPRILQATKRIVNETEVTPVLLGNPDKIRIYLEIEGVLDGYEVIDPHSYPGFEEMVASLVERRKGKMTEEEARQVLKDDVNYFGVMLVHMGIVDGMVSGAIHSTAATVRPALQIIKTRPNVKRTSGAFLMVRGSERYLFGDCAININPDAEGLAEIAINSAITAKMFGIDPKIAMLSYSTKGSGFGESVDKVVEATKLAHELRPDLEIEGVLDGYEVIDPHSYPGFEEMVASLVDRRKGKMTEEEARQILKDDVNYFGVMLVHLGIVDGMVSGAIHSTAATVRPALQIIKTRPNVKRTSGAFLMVRGSERYLFGDCAININPDAEGLAEIAINSAITAKMFGIDPKIAMLSYSTKGSGFGESVDKVVEATKLAHELRPDLEIDGELQFDAAFVPATAALKAPGSKVAGQANVFIFPGIEAGNIGYKMAERLGGFAAVGPVLQGLNKPVNDLSRGCNSDDVYKLTLITAAQAVEQ